MRVTLLGTGCPPADVLRHGPATLVCAGPTRLLVDCGSGVSQRLIPAGCAGRDIDALLLTHLHSDHLVDLYQLVISSWHAGRPRALRSAAAGGQPRRRDDRPGHVLVTHASIDPEPVSRRSRERREAAYVPGRDA